MTIEEISQSLNKIERYEDDVYDIILCVKRNYDDCKIGILSRALRFDSLEEILINALKKENCLNDNCIIELSQGVIYKSDLYVTIYFNERTMFYSKK